MLLTVYAGYYSLTALLLDVARTKPAITGARSAAPASEFTDLIRKWFSAPADRWVASAGKKFRDGQRYLFFQEFHQADNSRNLSSGDPVYSMIVQPVAVLWMQDGEDHPVTITAEKAQLDRTEPLSLEKPEFGRIRRGILSGVVTLRGPQGLWIQGTNFTVDEESLKIFSSHPVEFAWDRHRGRAENGVEIQLLTAAENRDGLMSVSDVQSIRLNGRVRCEMVMESDGSEESTETISINAARGFEFLVQERLATFFGFEDRRDARSENQIVVQRPIPSGQVDQLVCTQLTLQLRPRIRPPGAQPGHSGGMELQSVHAEGSRVLLSSQEHGIKALLTSLRYTVDSRTIELAHPSASAAGRTANVEIRQGGTRVLAPRIVAILGDDHRIRSAECSGPGMIMHQGESDTSAVEADWSGTCIVDQFPRRRVELRGNARVVQAARNLALTGESIAMTLLEGDDGEAASAGSPDQPGDAAGGLNFSRLRPDVLTAKRNVTLSAPQVNGIAREQMTVNFRPATAHSNGPPESGNSADGGRGADPAAATFGEVDAAAFTHFEADTMQADVVNSTGPQADSSPARISQIWISGNVSVEYTAVDPDNSFSARGNVLHAEDGFSAGRDISLFGDPATIMSATRVIEGQRIDLNDLRRDASVRGSGRIRLVVERDMSGSALETPAPLDIYWGDRMTFSGTTAEFVGNIRGVITAAAQGNQKQHLELRCPVMKVFLAENGSRPKPEKQRSGGTPAVLPVGSSRRSTTEIERIECESRVDIRVERHTDGSATERHLAMVSDLKVNLQTGEVAATGPGWIESTQPDQGNQLKVASAVTVQANRTVRARDNPFVFVRASFIGNLSGNFEQRVMRLHQHVAGVFGPVRRLGDQIEVNAVSAADLPDQTGILRCELLTVHAIPGVTSDQQSFALIAETNADLESRQFKGSADRITYDHSKQQYVLRADPGGLATVFHHPENSGESRSFVGQGFKYYPRRNELKGDDLVGVRGTE